MKMNKNIKIAITSLLLTTGLMVNLSPMRVQAWASQEDVNIDDTHKLIALQALKAINNDLNQNTESPALKNALAKLNSLTTQLRAGAVAPDFGEVGVSRDYSIFQDHFYNPYTGKNYTPLASYPGEFIPDNALTQSSNYFGRAIGLWKDGKFEDATLNLGRALHYVGDINQPHHASDCLGGPGTAHAKFEDWADVVRDQFKIDSLGYDTSKGQYAEISSKFLYPSDFAEGQMKTYAFASNALSKYCQLSNSWDEWNYAAKEALKNSQTAAASFIYRFLQEVSSGKILPQPAPIGDFSVVIHTGADKWDGTNDNIYFGMETSTGKKFERKCDLPGDDFEPNYTTGYRFTITDPDFKASDVKRVWIRKGSMINDDYKLANFQLYFKDIKVLDSAPNAWITGNNSYSVNVNGLWK